MTATDQVVLLECNLDDMTGEELGFALEEAMAGGALDAWFTAIQMKKGRPGVLFSLLCREGDAPRFRTFLLEQTTTLGVRWTVMEREIAERRQETVETSLGPVRCKLKILGGRVVSVKPEHDDCARLARSHGLPLLCVVETIRRETQHLLQK